MQTVVKTLTIDIPNDRLANWMVINNLLHGKDPKTVRWNGVLIDLTETYEPFDGGAWPKGLDHVSLSDTSQTEVRKIPATQFNEGFLFIVIGQDPAGSVPSKNPQQDANKLWNESLHRHVTVCKRGIVLWKYRDNEVRIRLADESQPEAKYRFECDTKGSLEIAFYDAQGGKDDLSDKKIEHVSLQGPGNTDPKDVMNPPRYP